ncbi:hypothetical protein ELG97_14115 [Rhizobium leguminosarum]|nr:hypothetical protein [Rhizobium leguminosarum bv. viciae]RWX38750.1 hypothetical protein EHH54_17200 [Rhizobium leguminosarum]TBE55385.1 hypothetical protein ELH04_13610 [Rhizobium leguminosarum]TBE92960.1 hypothetical protein ELG97_14115 [Rhizobium leguminosarum]
MMMRLPAFSRGRLQFDANTTPVPSRQALCRGSAAPDADARDKPEHDERGVGAFSRGRLCGLLGNRGSVRLTAIRP